MTNCVQEKKKKKGIVGLPTWKAVLKAEKAPTLREKL